MSEIHVLSLGAGVQSSTMALMAAAGELTPMPSAAIFADTQAEPKAVYDWLRQLESMLPFPVHHVTAGSLIEETLRRRPSPSGSAYIRNYVPAFTRDNDGNDGMLHMRKCTSDFKIAPIKRKARALMLAAGAKRVTQWIGISRDEAGRMKPSRVKYITNHYPLVDLGITRHDCLRWMEKRSLPRPPKSACSFCPYRNDAGWRELKLYDKAAFEQAAQFERDWNIAAKEDARPSQLRGQLFLHRSRVPLDQVDFSNAEDRGQLNMFNNECEGMCGV